MLETETWEVVGRAASVKVEVALHQEEDSSVAWGLAKVEYGCRNSLAEEDEIRFADDPWLMENAHTDQV